MKAAVLRASSRSRSLIFGTTPGTSTETICSTPGRRGRYRHAPSDTYNPANYAGDGTGTGLGSSYRDAATRDWGLRFVLRPRSEYFRRAALLQRYPGQQVLHARVVGPLGALERHA